MSAENKGVSPQTEHGADPNETGRRRNRKVFSGNGFARLIAALLLCCALSGFFAAAQAAVPVRAGEHADYTRLVFDFPHTTAYRVSTAPGKVTLALTTPENIVLPGTDTKLIDSFAQSRKGGVVTVSIGVPKGVSVKDYRLDEKIVLDIYAPKQKQKPEKTANNAPLDLVPAKPRAVTTPPMPPKPAPPPQSAKPQTPPEAQPQAAAEAKTEPGKTEPSPEVAKLAGAAGMNNSAIIVDEAPPPETGGVEGGTVGGTDAQAQTPAPPMEPTVITLSSLEPARLAVFKRFRTLWIVMDSETMGALTPETRGPEAGLLGNAKPLKFKGGMAFRYLLPPGRYLNVEKQGLTWRVNVTARPEQSSSDARFSVDFDKTSRRAKLMAEMKDAGSVMQVPDPEVGDTLDVVASGDPAARVDKTRHFADVTILPAAIGMVVQPLSDDIKVSRVDNFVFVTSPRGITASMDALSGPMAIKMNNTANEPDARLFDFPDWRQGGLPRLDHNVEMLLHQAAAAQTQDERTALLMKLALLYFANDFGQETLGVLHLIEQEDKNLPKNANFIALRGAAEALAGHYDDAIKDLSNPAIQNHPEVAMWIGYAAAATGRWHMAERNFPADNYLLLEYPPDIAVPFTIDMAESALRLGRMDTADKLLDSLDAMKSQVDPHYEAAINYLKGEAARQAGNDQLAVSLWTPVAMGLDRLYHTKASLALANLQLQNKTITLKQAIEDVDSLRFAWRGDGLEVQILHNLGKLKLQDRQFLSGLEDLKTAAKLSRDLHDDPQPIDDDITDALTDLFVNGRAKEIPPLQAVSIYNEFSGLLPQGETGAVAAINFADSLIGMDLLDKAEDLLNKQLDDGQVPADRVAAVGAKLAAVYLLDAQPQQAISALAKTARDKTDATLEEKRALLKARAQSKTGQTDAAIATLAGVSGPDAQRLKADVLWRAKRWDAAAKTIIALLPAPGSALDDQTAQLVVNAAVACKLAGDAGCIADLRKRYGEDMKPTALSSTFGVVTRTGESASLSDRGTILKIAGEVDMFKNFLDSYKAGADKTQ
ncbi:MAG: hypothetical protein GC185_02975 [Alphaproteobacteria bacterium]|nr:hypothetical protein [Alphaproteobacteria bacterium]